MYDVIYEAEIALCNMNKQPLQLILVIINSIYTHFYIKWYELKYKGQSICGT